MTTLSGEPRSITITANGDCPRNSMPDPATNIPYASLLRTPVA